MELVIDERHLRLQADEQQVRELLTDLYVVPRRLILRWSRITGQTAQVRLAYPGQHLASVVTGVPGSGTAARGHDLRDGSEVKSCSRADQLGGCRDCQVPVLPWETSCSVCGSASGIVRKTDSHWIMAIKSEAELAQYTDATRIVFILFDRPDLDGDDVRVRVWEVWPGHPRHAYFGRFVSDYYYNNFLAKLERGATAAPCNLHPLKRDFLLMDPVLTFEAHIHQATGEDSEVEVVHWTAPGADREPLTPDDLPASLTARADAEALLDSELPDDLIATYTDGGDRPADAAAVAEMRGTPRGGAQLKRALVAVGPAGRRVIGEAEFEKWTKQEASEYQRRPIL
jgi:hypothetical protein